MMKIHININYYAIVRSEKSGVFYLLDCVSKNISDSEGGDAKT